MRYGQLKRQDATKITSKGIVGRRSYTKVIMLFNFVSDPKLNFSHVAHSIGDQCNKDFNYSTQFTPPRTEFA